MLIESMIILFLVQDALPPKEMDPAEKHCKMADIVLCLGTRYSWNGTNILKMWKLGFPIHRKVFSVDSHVKCLSYFVYHNQCVKYAFAVKSKFDHIVAQKFALSEGHDCWY